MGLYSSSQPCGVSITRSGHLLGISMAITVGDTGWGSDCANNQCSPHINWDAPTMDGAFHYDSNRQVVQGFITRWNCRNRGSWGCRYGDQNSNFVYAMGDLTRNVYRPVRGAAFYKHLVHYKKPGAMEFVIIGWSIDSSYRTATNGISVPFHFHQTGEAADS